VVSRTRLPEVSSGYKYFSWPKCYVILLYPILLSFKNNVEIETGNTILYSTFRHPIFSVFPAKTLYVFLISIMHATCHNSLLEFVNIIKSYVLCKVIEPFITHFSVLWILPLSWVQIFTSPPFYQSPFINMFF